MNEIPVHGKAAKSTSHTFEVQYWIYKEPHRDYIEVEIIGEDALASVLAEYVEDYVHEVFEDVVFDALRQGTASMNELGVYNIYTVATDVYKAAEAYIEEKSSEMSLVIVDDYSNTQSPKTISFNVIPILKTMLADRQTCECWSVDVGGAISGDIMDFQDNGVWQFGLSSAETIYCNLEEWPTPKRLNGVVVWEAENEELTPTLWFSRKGQSPM